MQSTPARAMTPAATREDNAVQRLKPYRTLIACLSLGLGFFYGSCGVNSGNPVGKQKMSKVSVYVQDAPLATIRNFVMRVRGVQLISNIELTPPRPEETVEILFPEAKIFDLLDFSSDQRISLLSEQDVPFRDYYQLRLLFDADSAAQATLFDGSTKKVYVLPVELTDGYTPDPPTQLPSPLTEHRLVLASPESILSSPEGATVVADIDLSRLLLEPVELRSVDRQYLRDKKGLSDAEIEASLILRPYLKPKPSLFEDERLGVLITELTFLQHGRLCFFEKNRWENQQPEAIVDACGAADYVAPFRFGGSVTSIPQGEYLVVVKDDQSGRQLAQPLSLTIRAGDNLLVVASDR